VKSPRISASCGRNSRPTKTNLVSALLITANADFRWQKNLL
jgi:hypothetical protein